MNPSFYEAIREYVDKHYASDQKSSDEFRTPCPAEKCQSVEDTNTPARDTAPAAVQKQRHKQSTCDWMPTYNITCASASVNYALDFTGRLEESFGTLLVKYIREKGKTNADIYKEANIDRRLFSKIISNDDYSPTKGTVLALAIALKLDLNETSTFLKRAGYALTRSSKSDLVVEYFISETNGHYNIDIVNDALCHFQLPTLGSRL